MTAFKTIIHEIALPCKELSHLASHFWHSRWVQGVQNYFCYYSTANTNCELAFAFSPKNTHRRNNVFASFQGHTETHSQIETGGFSEMFGVSLYAHAAPLLFGVPVAQLANQLVDIKELLHQDAEVLNNQLARSGDFAECIRIMTHYLKAKINKVSNQDLVMLHAIEKIRAMRGRVDIRSLASELSLSQKQFERRFKKFPVLTPSCTQELSDLKIPCIPIALSIALRPWRWSLDTTTRPISSTNSGNFPVSLPVSTV